MNKIINVNGNSTTIYTTAIKVQCECGTTFNARTENMIKCAKCDITTYNREYKKFYIHDKKEKFAKISSDFRKKYAGHFIYTFTELSNNKLIYIGQSISIYNRAETHKSLWLHDNNDIKFQYLNLDTIIEELIPKATEEMKLSILRKVESKLIHKFKPIKNIRYGVNSNNTIVMKIVDMILNNELEFKSTDIINSVNTLAV